MRALREPDAFPAGDLGVRRALASPGGPLPRRREVLARAERWRPWRAYAALALWTDEGGARGPAETARGRSTSSVSSERRQATRDHATERRRATRDHGTGREATK
jgi:hypothetical protein